MRHPILVGDETAKLREHIGRRVEVDGTVQAQQETASRTTARPKSGRPARAERRRCRFQTEIEIKRLWVSSAKPLDEKCD